MNMTSFAPIYGTIQKIESMVPQCCSMLVSISTENGEVNVVVSGDTAVVDCIPLQRGMQIVAFYDVDAPAPLIFPPQYQAVVIARRRAGEEAALGYFDDSLILSDQSLKLNVAGVRDISTMNGQRFFCKLGGQYLLVFYTRTTRSIPPQTTPHRIIVCC